MTKKLVSSYTVRGEIQNYNNSKFYIEVLDDDQHWFDDRIDDLLGSSWTDDSGRFEVTFDDDLFRESWFEGRPELFVIVRDSVGKIVHKTKRQNPSGPDDSENLSFHITIPEKNHHAASPYDSVNTRRMAAFAGIGDALDLTDDIANPSQLLLQSLNAWLLYTNESKWRLIGYDGPQVDRYPWRSPPTHRLSWRDQ